jgi:hypothetical protein
MGLWTHLRKGTWEFITEVREVFKEQPHAQFNVFYLGKIPRISVLLSFCKILLTISQAYWIFSFFHNISHASLFSGPLIHLSKIVFFFNNTVFLVNFHLSLRRSSVASLKKSFLTLNLGLLFLLHDCILLILFCIFPSIHFPLQLPPPSCSCFTVWLVPKEQKLPEVSMWCWVSIVPHMLVR